MIRVGVLSDTHGFLHSRVASFFEGVNEIWHAGDIGNQLVIEQLERIAPVVAVHGNIDDYTMRLKFPEYQFFEREGMKIMITHIAGAAGKYHPEVLQHLSKQKPGILVCGHSHILKIQYFENLGHLYINPGAAGMNGFHRMLTAVRFQIEAGRPAKMEVLEIPRG